MNLGNFPNPVAAQIAIINLLAERGALSFRALQFLMPDVATETLGKLVDNLNESGAIRWGRGVWKLVSP